MDTFEAFQQRNRAFVEASFHVSLCITKAKSPHTIAEELILPRAKDINRILMGKKAESKLNISSLSVDAVHSSNLLMSENIKDQVIDQLK